MVFQILLRSQCYCITVTLLSLDPPAWMSRNCNSSTGYGRRSLMIARQLLLDKLVGRTDRSIWGPLSLWVKWMLTASGSVVLSERILPYGRLCQHSFRTSRDDLVSGIARLGLITRSITKSTMQRIWINILSLWTRVLCVQARSSAHPYFEVLSRISTLVVDIPLTS